jgi:CHASE2 domain-containing sensor protein
VTAKKEAEHLPWYRLGRKFWMPFLLACALVISLEVALDHVAESGELPGVTQSLFNVSWLYRWIVAAPRDPIPRYTAVVEINPKTDPDTPTLLHICEQRGATARLLRTIALALPRVIVLDKHYEPQSPVCPQDPDFLKAIQDLRQASIPVIIGRRVEEQPVRQDGEERRYLKPSLKFWSPDTCPEGPARPGQACMEGVTAFNNDTRKLPLEWALYANEKEAKDGKGLSWHDTLALNAAKAYDPKITERHSRLAAFLKNGQHPYLSFFPNEDIAPISAGLLLSQNEVPISAGTLIPASRLSSDLRKLSGKIVLIGEINWDQDTHPSVVGKSPGLYLQDNYIEALLDDRYFRPMPVLDYVVGFIVLFVLELILTFDVRWWGKVLFMAALFVVCIGVVYLFIKLLGWYVNPGAVGITAIVIKLIQLIQPLFSRAEEAISDQPVAEKS